MPGKNLSCCSPPKATREATTRPPPLLAAAGLLASSAQADRGPAQGGDGNDHQIRIARPVWRRRRRDGDGADGDGRASNAEQDAADGDGGGGVRDPRRRGVGRCEAACPTSGAGVCGAPTLVVALWRQQAVVVRRTARSGSRFRSDASLVRSGVAWSPVVVIFDM